MHYICNCIEKINITVLAKNIFQIKTFIIFKDNADQLSILRRVRRYCDDFNVMFKLNTVVNKFNVDEDMIDNINEINPIRLAPLEHV